MAEAKVGSVNDEKQPQDKEGAGVNIGRHQAQCQICSSPYRQQIEEEWISWNSPQHFKAFYDIHPYTLYRHMHAFDLFSKRRKNVTMALEKIVERMDSTSMSGSVILSAIKALAKINGNGLGGEHVQGTDPKEFFQQMSEEERLAFAIDGSLPARLSKVKAATPSDSQRGSEESETTETKRLQ
jgi:hypothetical protein